MKKGPVRRPSTPTQTTQPKPTQKGPRSSPLSIQYRLRSTAILADSSRGKASLLGIEDRLIVQVGDSVAFLRSSEEDVYYRIDSICRRNGGQHGVAKIQRCRSDTVRILDAMDSQS